MANRWERMTPMSSHAPKGIEVEADHDHPVVPERFKVHSEATANWLVRRIIEARGYHQSVKAWADREIKRADRDEAFFLGRYGPELESWLHRQLQGQHRRRSIPLPAGTVGFRRQPPKLMVLDEPAVLAWARTACPEAVEAVTTTRLRKRALIEHLSLTGEMPPSGAEFQNEPNRLYIR